MPERVVAAMSGGVDSSVAAALLVEQGYEVIGITLNVWPEASDREDACCSLSAVEDARRVAARLGIPHYVLNFRDIFARFVIEDFAAKYRAGHTPNPCIRCNEHIKFGGLLRKARELQGSFVATGHYARLVHEEGRYRLYRAADRQKDQTYFLYPLTQQQLGRTLLPVGGYAKAQIRQMARRWDLPVAERAESQEICFVESDYRDFLRQHCGVSEEPGPIVDMDGQVVGQHRGLAFYTLGQRKGLGVYAPQPLYIVEMRPESNTLVVGPEEALWGDTLVAEGLNLVGLPELAGPLEVTAKVRYRSPEAEATVYPQEKDQVEVRFRQPQRAITPGQAVVFYLGDMLVGGATIVRAGALSSHPDSN